MLARDCLEVSEEQGKIPEEPHRRLSTLEGIGVESLSQLHAFSGLCEKIFNDYQELRSLPSICVGKGLSGSFRGARQDS